MKQQPEPTSWTLSFIALSAFAVALTALFTGFILYSPVQADRFLGEWTLIGPSRIHGEKGVILGQKIVYDKDFEPTFDVSITNTSSPKQLQFTLTHKGHAQQIIGQVKNDSLVVFPSNQQSPIHVEGDGFSADLRGKLRNGSGVLSRGKLRIRTVWDVRGRLNMGFSVDIEGWAAYDIIGNRQ